MPRLLLGELRTAGWQVRHHGDFDLGGVAIMDHLTGEGGCDAVAVRSESYEHALPDDKLPALPARAATGSEGLEGTLADRGLIVIEELVLAELIDELRRVAPRRA